MNRMVTLLSRIYRFLTRLYPTRYRDEFSEEQAQVFELALQEAISHGGPRGLTYALLQALLELRDLPGALLRARFYWRDRDMISQLFPQASERTPWGAALLSLLPFFLLGPVLVVVGYIPAWREIASSLYASRLTGILVALTLTAGLVIGAWLRFPRWSYPYSVFGVFMLMMVAFFMVKGIPWNINDYGSVLVYLVIGVILLTRLVPSLRPYQTNLRQDWTQLSYGLYSITLVVVSLHDTDAVPRFNLLILLPSLVCLAGMLAYLRLGSSIQRFISLLASVLVAVFLWMLPVFDGGTMLGVPGGSDSLRFLLATWGILLTLTSAPVLIGVYNALAQRRTA